MIPGTVPLTGPIAPTETTDTYPVQTSTYGKGGHHEVANAAARNAITTLRRTTGMLATTQDDGQTWKLNPEPWDGTDADWSQFGNELAVVTYAAALPVAATVADTAPAGVVGVEWTVVLVKGNDHRISLLTAIRDGGGVVSFLESQVLTAPSGSTYDLAVTAGGGFGGITLIITPASTGWSVRGIRRPL
jgi:hypothetical protein